MPSSNGSEVAVSADTDQTQALTERIRAASIDSTPLAIRGGGSKAFYGHAPMGEVLAMDGHRGVLNYEPTELMLTARAGTPLAEIEQLLADNGQMLAFEPPHFDRNATLGGAIAAGLAGPRRPFAGAVRDHVLGVRLIDGRARVQRFGGEVMKNVAGYDVSRLMVGALGTLGVLLDVSLKVLPRPEAERSIGLDLEPGAMTRYVETALRTGAPITGAAHDGVRARIRLSGAESAVGAGVRHLGGEPLDGTDFWPQLRDHRLPFLRTLRSDDGPLWRIALPPGTMLPEIPGERIVDWNGQQVWLRSPTASAHVRAAARDAGGHATLFRGGDGSVPVFTRLSPAVHQLHEGLKQVFDPGRILNRGRMYADI